MPGELLHANEVRHTAVEMAKTSDEEERKSIQLEGEADELPTLDVQNGVAQVKAITLSWSKRSLVIVYAS
jgi:hypothetical protein